MNNEFTAEMHMEQILLTLKKEKTMAINKHVDNHNTTGIAQVSMRDQCNSCGVVIIDMLVDRHCFFLLHLICHDSPPGGVISLVLLWFPWWFL